MNCPYCDHEASPRALHAHFVDEHPEEVRVRASDNKRTYDITCPVCGDGYSQPIKPRLLDPAFLDEFDREIRLVAFDMLVNHLLAEHIEPEAESPDTSSTHQPDPRPDGGPDDHRPKL